jgi:Holliday junction resolvase
MGKESVLQNNILAFLKEKVGGHWIKIHGSSYQSRGEPDIIGVHDGTFYAFEIKRDDGKGVVSELQLYKLKRINDAGGVGMIVDNLDMIKELFNVKD